MPVHGEPVRPHVDSVLLLLETEDCTGNHQVAGSKNGERHPAAQGTYPPVQSEQMPEHGKKQVQQERRREQERHDHRIHDETVRAELIELVQLHRDVGVEDYAPENQMRVDNQAYENDRDEHGGQSVCGLPVPAPYDSSVDVTPYEIEAPYSQKDEQGYDQDRAERVEELSVGVDGRGEEHGAVLNVPSPEICGRNGREQGCKHNQQMLEVPVAAQKQQRGDDEEHQGQPGKHRVRHN